MRIKKRIKSRAGFTLAETLLAVLILLLVSTIVATGVPAARNAYEKVILASNADALLSTAVSTLRDELGTAWKVQDTTGGVTYFSADTGNRSKLYVNGDGNIRLLEFSETSTAEAILGITKKAEDERDLVFQAAGDTALKLTCNSIETSKDDDAVLISGLCVKNAKNTDLAKWDVNGDTTLKIPVFSKGNPEDDP